MKLLKMKPYDSTFFRDGNDFAYGISDLIESKNIPYSSTFFGAIFTAILSQNEKFKENFFGKSLYDHEKILRLGQIYIYDEIQKLVYISAPKDIFLKSDESCEVGKYKRLENGETSLKTSYYLDEPEYGIWEQIKENYILLSDFIERYPNQNLDAGRFKNENEIFVKNSKVGISIDNSINTVKESMLYTIEETEFYDSSNHKWSFLVEYEVDNNYVQSNYNIGKMKNLDKGYLKLGGESKVCCFEDVENIYVEKYQNSINDYDFQNNKFLKIVFTSDTIFKENILNIFDSALKVVAIVNEKPIYIGGYDMKSDSQGSGGGSIRKMYKGYAAGTVIILEKNMHMSKSEVINYLNLKIKGSNSKGFNEFYILEGEIDGK